jgi:hypothetical protein
MKPTPEQSMTRKMDITLSIFCIAQRYAIPYYQKLHSTEILHYDNILFNAKPNVRSLAVYSNIGWFTANRHCSK